jgi:hypothetical protein
MTKANQPGIKNFNGVGWCMDTFGEVSGSNNQQHLPSVLQAILLSGTPSLRKMMAMGQKLVSPNWNRFKPTKAVKAKNQLLTNKGLACTPSAKEVMMNKPATTRIYRSTVISNS